MAFSNQFSLGAGTKLTSGRDIRLIVDRRRCYVQTHVSGCPTSFYGNSFNQSLANIIIPYPYQGICPTSFDEIQHNTSWSLPNSIPAGIAIYYYSCADPNDFLSAGNTVNILAIQVGDGSGNLIDHTTATISVQSPDIANTYPTIFTDFAAFGGSVVNHQISGNVDYINGESPVGLGLYSIPLGSCVTITISDYTGLQRVSVGSAVPTNKKPDLRPSFTVNATTLASGQPVVLNLCLCPTITFDTSMCPPLVNLVPAPSENWFEKAIESLPVQIALGTVGTILAIASGVGLWCLIKRKKAKSEGYQKI